MKTLPTSPHRLRRLALAVALTLALPAAAAPDTRAAKYYEDALTRYEKKDIAGAIIQLKNALQIDKSLLPVQVLLGKALLANGEAIAAEVALQEAARLGVSRAELVLPLAESHIAQGKQKNLLSDPLFATGGLPASTTQALLLLKAAASADLGDPRSALKTIEEARALDPRSVDLLLAEIPVRIRAGQVREAADAARRALASAPDNAEAWYQSGTVSHLGGALNDALAAYDKALQLRPEHIEARISRAGLRIDAGDYAAATADASELRRLSPREPRGAYLRALLADLGKRPAETRSALQEVTALLDPVPPEFLRYRPQILMLNGLAHLGLGETSKAQPLLEAFRTAQGASPASKLLAEIYLGERETAKAISVLEEYLRSHPGDPQAINLLAAAHMADGRPYKATALIQEALSTHETPALRASLGLSLIRGGQAGDALDHLETAFRKDNGQIPAGTALVGLYLRSDRPAQAVGVAEAMLKKRPESAALNNLLGMAQAAAGHNAAARTAYERAIRLDPELLAAALNLARLDVAVRDFDAAAKRLANLIRQNDRHTDAMFEMARLAELRGDAADALRWLEKAADAEGSRQVRAALALVDLRLRQNQPPLALEAAKHAAGKAPDNVTVLLALATTELANGNADSARVTLNLATRYADYDASYLIRVAALQLAAGDANGAAYSLEKALSTAPALLPAQIMMTEVELRRGDHAKAEKRARQLADKYPKLAIGHQLQGDVALVRGQRASALEAYRRAHQVAPSAGTLLKLFAALIAQGDLRAALQLGEPWIKTHPGDLDVRQAVADTHARSGNFPAAKAAYHALLRQAPDHVVALNNLANVLLRLGDAGALSIAEQALRKDPGNANAIDTLGWIHFSNGDTERALPLLRDARLRSPENPDIRYHLAAALARIGRTQEARAEAEAALKLSERFEHADDSRKLLASLK